MNELKKKLANKWILFDTNILIKASRFPKAFLSIFSAFLDAKCQPAYTPLIRAEFSCSIFQPELILAQEKFLEDLNMILLPMKDFNQLTNEVIDLSRFVKSRKKSPPDIVDLYTAALIKKHAPNLILLTMNHQHFAHTLKRFDVLALDLNEEEVPTIGFYESR